MTFLPVMDRELRVAARKRSTFWLRVIAALVAIVIGALLMMLSWIGAFPSPTLGRMLFSTLTWMALAVALAAGPFLTADCLSEEKREGTLGFLFLTSLRGYDVAGGKLLAASWRAAFALIAVIPILALALVLGGVTGSQFWKTALALLNALFCSLTAGLMISAVSRDAQKALGGTVVVLLLVVLVGPGVESGLRLHSGRPLVLFSLASPLYAFAKAQAWGRTPFWLALAVSHAVGWVMLALACLAVPRCWRDRRTPKLWQAYHRWKYGSARWRQKSRLKLLDRNPVLWLCCRQRWQSLALWAAALVVAGLLIGLLISELGSSPLSSVVFRSSWPMRALVYLWMASQAGRFFVQARRSGFIELVLAAPVTAQEVVLGQWRALLRTFGAPLALLLVVQFACGFLSSRMMWGLPGGSPFWGTLGAILIGLASMLSMAASLAALAWFGMWMGMTSRNAGMATLKTILFVKVIPTLAIYFVTLFATALLVMPLTLLMTGASTAPVTTTTTNSAGRIVVTASSSANLAMLSFGLVWTCVPAVLTIVASIGLAALARSRLLARFRQLAAGSLAPARVDIAYRAPPPVRAPPVIGAPAQ